MFTSWLSLIQAREGTVSRSNISGRHKRSGVGVSLVSLVGWVVYHQSLDIAALIGISLIVAGVISLNFFSKVVH